MGFRVALPPTNSGAGDDTSGFGRVGFRFLDFGLGLGFIGFRVSDFGLCRDSGLRSSLAGVGLLSHRRLLHLVRNFLVREPHG